MPYQFTDFVALYTGRGMMFMRRGVPFVFVEPYHTERSENRNPMATEWAVHHLCWPTEIHNYHRHPTVCSTWRAVLIQVADAGGVEYEVLAGLGEYMPQESTSPHAGDPAYEAGLREGHEDGLRDGRRDGEQRHWPMFRII